MGRISRVYTFIFSLLCIVVPFTDSGEAIPNIVLAVCLAVFPFVVKNKDFNQLKQRSIVVFILFALSILIEILIFQRWEDFTFWIRILIFPILFVLSLPIRDRKIPLISFALSAFLLSFLICLNLGLFYLETGGLQLDVGSQIDELIFGDRPYIGFVLVISVCLSLYLSTIFKHQKLIKSFFVLNVLLNIGVISLISARLSLLSLVLIAFSFVFYSSNKKKILGVVLIGILSLPVLFLVNDNLRSRFFLGFEQKDGTIEKVLILEPRYHIWGCIKNFNPSSAELFVGLGFQGSQQKLNDCYATKTDFQNNDQQKWFVDTRFNSHNQFLNFYISNGILVLGLFLLFFILLFKENHTNYYSTILVLGLFLFCVFENILSRQMGAMLFGLVCVFIQWIPILSPKNAQKSEYGDE